VGLITGGDELAYRDYTTVVGLITRGDELVCRDEVQRLVEWCAANNLTLNTKKTKVVIMDFRRHRAAPAPLYINGDWRRSCW
jgi:DNA gyrase inhibitor GyrI